tara:strand:+ start:63 stop:386 length:324 start_codon:yes stop_codon:yes gene_type:complete
MSKYLKEDSREHHYEKEVKRNISLELNRIGTLREMSNEAKYRLELNYKSDIISHDDFGKGVHHYATIIKLTNICKLMCETKNFSEDYEKYIREAQSHINRLEVYADA